MASPSPDAELKKAIKESLAYYKKEDTEATVLPSNLHSWQTIIRDKTRSLEQQLSLNRSDKISYEKGLSDDLAYMRSIAAYSPHNIAIFEEHVVRRLGICNGQLLLRYPLYVELDKVKVQSPYWRIEKNAADGHCFYHTVLRFIYNAAKADPDNDFFESLKVAYLPTLYNPERQQSRDVFKLRETNLTALKEITTVSPATSYKAYTDAIRESEHNQGVDSSGWAGNGPHAELEFQAMANLLQICIVIWKTIPSKYSVTWGTQSFIPNKTEDYFPRMDLNRDCPNGVMYGVNSMGGQHFDSVMPAIAMPSVHSASPKYDFLEAKMNSMRLDRSREDTSNDKFIAQMVSAGHDLNKISEAITLSKNDPEVAKSLLVMDNKSLNKLINELHWIDPKDIIQVFKTNNSNLEKTKKYLLDNYFVIGGKRTRHRHKKDKKDKKDKKATRRRRQRDKKTHKKTTKPNRHKKIIR